MKRLLKHTWFAQARDLRVDVSNLAEKPSRTTRLEKYTFPQRNYLKRCLIYTVNRRDAVLPRGRAWQTTADAQSPASFELAPVARVLFCDSEGDHDLHVHVYVVLQKHVLHAALQLNDASLWQALVLSRVPEENGVVEAAVQHRGRGFDAVVNLRYCRGDGEIHDEELVPCRRN